MALVFSFLVFSATGYAAVDPLSGENGARAVSLGNAFVGMANDATSIFANVAGLTGVSKISLMSMYSQPEKDVLFTSFGAAVPNSFGGAIGLGYRRKQIANVLVSSESINYIEQDISFGYAKDVGKAYSLGGTVRYIFRGPSRDVAGTAGANGNGATFDFGLKAFPRNWLNLGLSFQGVLGKITYKNNTSDDVSSNATLGSSIKIMGTNGYIQNSAQDLWLNLDINKIVDENIYRFHPGVEWWPTNSFAVRAGLDQSPNPNASNQALSHFSAGFGLKYGDINIDYAYKKLSDPSQTTRHYFSVCYTPQPSSQPATQYVPPPSISQNSQSKVPSPLLPAATAEARQKSVSPLSFTDVPKNYWAKEAIEKLSAMGILDYYSDGTFRPERPISRAETVTLLIKAKEGAPPEHDENLQIFSDVLSTHWAADYINEAYKKKLTYGYPDRTFRPRNTTTRVEGIVFLVRFDSKLLSIKDVLRKPFLDIPLFHWGIKEILSAKDNRYLDYISGSRLVPREELTRAELAELLYRSDFTKQKMSDYVFDGAPSSSGGL